MLRTKLTLAEICVALGGCPAVIHDPPVRPPPPGCEPGATVCHEGAPWRCGPGGQWSQADRACARLSTGDVAPVCCETPSVLRPDASVHACVPAARCSGAGR